MDKDALKFGLATVWLAVYRATKISEREFRKEYSEKLLATLRELEAGWPIKDGSHVQLEFICDSIRGCGLFLTPYQKPLGADGILQDIQRLQRHLNSL